MPPLTVNLVLMPFLVKSIEMHIPNTSPIPNGSNSLSLLYSGLIARLSLAMIFFIEAIHVYTCHSYSTKRFDTELKHGAIMDFCQSEKPRQLKTKLKARATTFAIFMPSCTLFYSQSLWLVPNYTIPTGSMYVDVVTCIIFVIQDMQEGDALCGRFGIHTIGIQQHCHACDVSTTQLDNPNAACCFLLAANMALIAHNEDKSVCTRR
jgi:hypothetical protein